MAGGQRTFAALRRQSTLAKEAEVSIYMDQHDQGTTDDISEAALVQLQHSPYRAIRRVSCRFDDGVLTLIGRVPTFHHKQLAQTAVAGLVGVSQVDNQLEVS